MNTEQYFAMLHKLAAQSGSQGHTKAPKQPAARVKPATADPKPAQSLTSDSD